MIWNIVLANFIISLFSLTGGIFILWKKIITRRAIPYLVAFAAGVMLTTVFFDMLPEALSQNLSEGGNGNIFLPIFIGIIISFFIERFLLWFHHHESTHGLHPSLYLISFGDAIHNFIDGVVISASFSADFRLGLITTVAIAAHEIPQEIADFSILVHSGLTNAQALILNLVSGLTAVLGGILSYYFLGSLKGALPIMLSFSAGIFIYIAGSDLIPGLHKDFKEQKKWAQTIPLVLGILLMYALILLLGEK